MRAAKNVLGVGAKARERELGRDVDHGFETIGVVFQGLQQCAASDFQIATVERGNGFCARRSRSTASTRPRCLIRFESVAKHATRVSRRN